MRLFVAIDIPEEVKVGLRALVDRLRPLAKLTWSPIENLHITTKFIGEWPEPRLAEVETVLRAVRPPGAIRIAVRGLGWFPNARNPRVFWAGIGLSEKLSRLAGETEKALETIGVPLEQRAFHPHLTLARRRDPVPVEKLRAAVAEHESDDFGSFLADAFILYWSVGGRYKKLQEFPLASAS